MQTPTSPTDPQLSISSTLGGLTVALQVHLAPAAWQPPSAAQTTDEASAALAGLTFAMAAEMPQALGQAHARLQRSLDVALVLHAQAQLATALGLHDGAAAADTPAASAELPPHPSRSGPRAPSCADCKFKVADGKFWFCNHPTTPVDEVTGNPTRVCESARGSAPHKLCGVAGRLFEPMPDFTVISGAETIPITLTAAEAAQARWLPGTGPDISIPQPASRTQPPTGVRP